MPDDPHDPLHHTAKMKARLSETIDHVREDIAKVDDPRFRALFETSAEVLQGLVTAMEHYEAGTEEAWRR